MMWIPEAREGVDIAVGIVGFFTAAFFVVTVVAELTRTDALGWAVTLLALVVVLVGLLRVRRRIGAARTIRPEDDTL